jgi:hypothetical protein
MTAKEKSWGDEDVWRRGVSSVLRVGSSNAQVVEVKTSRATTPSLHRRVKALFSPGVVMQSVG